MGKGRTKNKRARKPEVVYQAATWPPRCPIAYFTTGDEKHGYADADLGGFYNPLEPVYKYLSFIHPGPALPLKWTPGNGWRGLVPDKYLADVTISIERVFTPMWYRFEPIQI